METFPIDGRLISTSACALMRSSNHRLAIVACSARIRITVVICEGMGLRCGEMMALEWAEVNLAKRQLTMARSEWKGHVTTTKGGRVRHLPLTTRLTDALKEVRHLRGARVLCDKHGASLTQKEAPVTMRRVAGRRR